MAATADLEQVLETLGYATEENKVDAFRVGQTIQLPAEGDIWISGDIHDHRRNFGKFVAAADLANNPNRHIVLHELIHGDHYDADGGEDSWRMLVKAAQLKADYPRQVHFLLANHDLAQIHGEGIMKAGVSVCDGFNKGIKRDFGDNRYKVQIAITEFLLSFPLAIRTVSGLWISHSIPSEPQIPNYDFSVFERELTGDDYKRNTGPVYQLIWGRKIGPAGVTMFADAVGASVLITGHQAQEAGYAIVGDRMIIIASDHNQGCFLPLSLEETYDIESASNRIQKFITLDVEPMEIV